MGIEKVLMLQNKVFVKNKILIFLSALNKKNPNNMTWNNADVEWRLSNHYWDAYPANMMTWGEAAVTFDNADYKWSI